MPEQGLPSGLEARGLQNPHVGPCDLSIRYGECVTIAGRSGSGKSLLLRMIVDLDPHMGDVSLDGVSRASMPAYMWRRLVGYVPAESAWWEDGVGQHFPHLEKAKALAPLIGLSTGLFDAPVSRLSTGEKQRMGLLRAITAEPKVLLLDEPCSALDETTTMKVEGLMADLLQQGLAIAIVSHNVGQIQRVRGRNLEVVDGQLRAIAS